MSDRTRRSVIGGVATILLAGCQRPGRTDETDQVTTALETHYTGIGNIELHEITEITHRDDTTVEATLRVSVSESEPVTATAVVTRDDDGWVVTDTDYPIREVLERE